MLHNHPPKEHHTTLSSLVGSWWRHDNAAPSMVLALCEGNPLLTGGFPAQRPCNASFFFNEVSLNKLLEKRLSGQWFEMHWCSCVVIVMFCWICWCLTIYIMIHILYGRCLGKRGSVGVYWWNLHGDRTVRAGGNDLRRYRTHCVLGQHLLNGWRVYVSPWASSG